MEMYNNEFLKQLDRQPNKTIYVRLIALTQDEEPIDYIHGRVTTGSITIDGASATRRICSITLVPDTEEFSNYIWTFNTKFKVEIGVNNDIDSTYPKTIWFNQGVYVISSFSTSTSTNNLTVTIQGKDKMCMLDGTVGGAINSQTVFDSYEIEDTEGVVHKLKTPLQQIIRDIVYQYGKEPMHNIIINDLNKTGLELLEYQYDTPLYLLRSAGAEEYTNATIYPTFKTTTGTVELDKLDSYDKYMIDGTFQEGEVVGEQNEKYQVARFDYGETVGYKEIDLTYPGDLIAAPGESITSVLDKIKAVLGDYEYFYDINGRFVFQQKQTYTNTAWSPIIQTADEPIFVDPYALTTPYSYTFSDFSMFTSFSNNPQLTNLKNDFTIIGTKDSNTPIHMRYAIDVKPTYYRTITVTEEDLIDYNNKYNLAVKPQESTTFWYDIELAEGGKQVDWREIIFQMQKDYRKFNRLDTFLLKVAEANPMHYPKGITGYEQYYIDIEGFWRYLFTPLEELRDLPGIQQQEYYWGVRYAALSESGINNTVKEITINEHDQTYFPRMDEKTKHYPNDTIMRVKFKNGNNITSNLSLKILWKDEDGSELSDDSKIVLYDDSSDLALLENQYMIFIYHQDLNGGAGAWMAHSENKYFENDSKPGWRKIVYEQPNQLLFWFDMLSTEDSTLGKFSAKKIGARQKIENDKNVKAIYYNDPPSIIFDSNGLSDNDRTGVKYFNVPETYYAGMFKRSAQGKSAKEAIDQLLYNYTYCTESVSISSLPVYYLEPNTIVYIKNIETGEGNEYLITRINLPLGHNATMSLTGTKMVPRLY